MFDTCVLVLPAERRSRLDYMRKLVILVRTMRVAAPRVWCCQLAGYVFNIIMLPIKAMFCKWFCSKFMCCPKQGCRLAAAHSHRCMLLTELVNS